MVKRDLSNLATLAAIGNNHDDRRVPPLARSSLLVIIGQPVDLQTRIVGFDQAILVRHRVDEASRWPPDHTRHRADHR